MSMPIPRHGRITSMTLDEGGGWTMDDVEGGTGHF